MEDRLHDESEEWLSEASGSEGDDSYDEDADVDGFSGPTTASGSQSGCMRNGYRVLVVEQAKSLQVGSPIQPCLQPLDIRTNSVHSGD